MVKEGKKSKRGPRDDRSVSSRGTKGTRGKSPKAGRKGDKGKRGKSPKPKSRKEGKGKDSSGNKNPENILEYIPQEYLDNVETAEPVLHFLPKMVASTDESGASGSTPGSGVQSNTKFPNLRVLLSAAEDDIRLHRARLQAAKANNINFLRSYKIENDEMWLLRQQRLNERTLMLSKLNTERSMILKELQESNVKGLTPQEMTQVQLARWQRALELYVYKPPKLAQAETAEEIERDLEFLGLLEKLLEHITEEEDMSEILSQAADMCSTLVDVTKQIVKDATEQVAEAEDVYQIRLEAHELFGRNALTRTEEIQNQFRINGRAALQIGNQLEFAESKRKRCESASVLIRRWWLMENTAEQESLSGEELNVEEEVRGVVPLASCRMDPLFTRRENSLDAARSLKQLRQVVRSRSGNANMSVERSDATVSRRFDLTANLIKRTSEALEQRLLNDFSEIYAKGGVYEFTTKPRAGQIEWKKLKDLARALNLFDNGRNLLERYVQLVIGTRLPELFDSAKIKSSGEEKEEENDDEEEFDMEATRSELTKLFHQLSEVCMEEFQLIAYIFDNPDADVGMGEVIPLKIARALCTRVIGDHKNGLQSRINDLLDSIDRKTDFDAGAKKLDTFVVIHEKASGLFSLLRDSAEKLVLQTDDSDKNADTTAVDSLKAFLNSQEAGLNNSHRHGYLNLELRLLHHECCNALDQAGCILMAPARIRVDQNLLEKGVLEEYRAPLLPISKNSIKRAGFNELLSGPLKQSVLRQPLIHATDSLARARLMFGSGKDGGETSARVITSIYSQMCNFYGQAFLYPIAEALQEMLKSSAPFAAPQLPFNEDEAAHDMGVDPAFWVALERIHAAAKAFDREMWAESKKGSLRVWELLSMNGENSSAIAAGRDCRIEFFSELEHRGEDAVLRALDTLSAHIQWIVVTGAEAMLSSGGARLFNQLSGQSGGPYAMSSGTSLEAPNSPAVKSLCYCLRVQFVQVQSALTPQSLSSFWTALSMRIYDILVTRLLQHWYVSTVGAVILARDVEALRSVSTLAGTKHDHWDILRELLTLYMTPPDALKIMLVGSEGDASSGKGLFQRAGREQSLVFMSRRVDFRYKTGQGLRKSIWATQLLDELKVRDPSDGHINMGLFAAGRRV
eukprot:CAMPEP_0113603118 /NCGR_PEP_ID=MMETSP0017_2-20120614/1110_1 /TAXON_ID=2856 /ORGANISM="Cylindrotheca closterium" /LENGTH=1139 /DNA_ID=CAMNT_0000511493 /DNA_START=306 /DNA_END=3725 /DNA_ORIENTATION=- /assembly_acc=CAM_ASM_000147